MGDGKATSDSAIGGMVPGPTRAPTIEGNEGQALADRPARRRRVRGGRRHKHSVRFTDAEQALVTAAAAAAGLTVPNLIAETMVASLTGRAGQQMPVADRRALAHELAAVRSLLTAIGGNVNQLAAKAHAGIVPAVAVIEATMNAVSRTVARLDAAIAPLDPRANRRTARRPDERRTG
ncbi:plasmid mobilization protein [Actinomadura citrea]|uniref:plasmid mobilization protein n=1 Tax=Actinomadura citrea TaxID=46158 RepID=UPI003CE5B3C0